MPEGPAIVILKEEAEIFEGKIVQHAVGTAAIDLKRLEGRKITGLQTHGKQLLICFSGFYVRIHLMLLGTYRINERRSFKPALSLQFAKGELNFYTCSVRLGEGSPEETFDWSHDVMSKQWKPQAAEAVMKKLSKAKVCDILMNQEVFAGVGNIIKNETLFRIKVHPESVLEKLPAARQKELVKEARDYSHDFYNWKKTGQLTSHLLCYKKEICPRCDLPILVAVTGRSKRKSYFCTNCQVLYK